MEDSGHVQMATNLATQLLQELDAKIQSTPNDPDKFLMKSKLQEISDNLKVRWELLSICINQGCNFIYIPKIIFRLVLDLMFVKLQIQVKALSYLPSQKTNNLVKKYAETL